jgi:phage terminase large subunit GpA-like protein
MTQIKKFNYLLLDSIREAASKSRKGVDDEDIVKWCESHVVLDGGYGITGPFRIDTSKYLIEPLRAFQDWNVKEIVILKATQTGGSLAAALMLEYSLVNRPLPSMMVCQGGNDAEALQTTRIIPSLKNNKEIAPFLPTDPRQLRKDGIPFKHVPFYINGPSPERLQSKTLGIVYLDEYWRYDDKNIYSYAKKRLQFYSNVGMSKLVIVSQAGTEEGGLNKAWLESTQEEWWVPCPKCNEYFYPDIIQFNASGSKWNDAGLDLKNPDGSYNFGKLENVLTLQCPNKECNHLMVDSPTIKQTWNNTGKYVQTNKYPLKGHRGFRWNSIHAHPWIDTIKEFLQATHNLREYGNVDDLSTFFQQRLAKCINVYGYAFEGKKAKSDVEYNPQDPIPNEVIRFMSVDVQKDYMVYLVRAWASDGSSRLIDFNKVFDIDDILKKQKEHGIPSKCVIMDSGHRTREVYGYGLDHGFFLVKGVGGRRSFTLVKRTKDGKIKKYYRVFEFSNNGGDPFLGTSNAGKHKVPLCLLAVDSIKDILQRLVDGKGSEWLALPSDKFDLGDYNKQLFSEYPLKYKDKFGNAKTMWKKVKEDQPNEAWDLEVYQIAAAIMHPDVNLLDYKPFVRKDSNEDHIEGTDEEEEGDGNNQPYPNSNKTYTITPS